MLDTFLLLDIQAKRVNINLVTSPNHISTYIHFLFMPLFFLKHDIFQLEMFQFPIFRNLSLIFLYLLLRYLLETLQPLSLKLINITNGSIFTKVLYLLQVIV